MPAATPEVDLQTSSPSPLLVRLRRLEALGSGAALVLAVGLGLAFGLSQPVAGALAAVALAGATAIATVLLGRRARSWRYAERGEDLYVARGLLVRRQVVVPYGRMQLIEVTAGPLETMFGLKTVRFHTAAAASDARIPGLSNAEADRLRDRLAALGEAEAAGL